MNLLSFFPLLASLSPAAEGVPQESSSLLYSVFCVLLAASLATLITSLFYRNKTTRLQTLLDAERTASAEKLGALQQARDQLADHFNALSADALRANNTAFLDLAKSTLEKQQLASQADLAARQQAIDTLVKPLRESLEKVDAKIADIEKTRAQSAGQLSQQLEHLNTAQLRLTTETSKLSTALRSTTAVGNWGEIQLRRVVEIAGMTAHTQDFSEQTTANNGTSTLRPDLLVHLPGNRTLVIDSKTPLQSYLEALNAPDDTTRNQHLKNHALALRRHIDALSAKTYWTQFPNTPEFVILFTPGDQLLSTALQTDPALLEDALAKKILLATPTTLVALLKTAALGWQQQALSQNAEKISQLGRQLHHRISTLLEHLAKLGDSLDKAAKAYNSTLGSLETNLLPAARNLAALGAPSEKSLPELPPIDTTPRPINKP